MKRSLNVMNFAVVMGGICLITVALLTGCGGGSGGGGSEESDNTAQASEPNYQPDGLPDGQPTEDLPAKPSESQ